MSRLCENTEFYFQEIMKNVPRVKENARKSQVYQFNWKLIQEAPKAPKKKEKKDQKKSTIWHERVFVHDMDSFEVAKKIIDRTGEIPLVHNLASDYRPGGGWRKGSMAQEESLFYRSTYALSLDTKYRLVPNMYPLKTNQVIFSPRVFVFKNIDYQLLEWDKCFEVDCIAMASIRNPKTIKGQLSPRDTQITEEKIRLLFQVAKEHKKQYLVLGASGSGAFHNPPQAIANIFAKVIAETFESFKEIHFAVLSTKDTVNFRIFS